ncbi:MAG: hypothetical protein LBS32_00400 [Clostridiales Family XIII bacterium]|jgi:hypothetical protein|nr:hypothetical protein [Clostridiales Family XIII bacterium]
MPERAGGPADGRTLICCRCNAALTIRRTEFSYLAHSFFAELPSCPVCGQAFVSEDLVNGRIADVERNLEDK